MDITKHPTLSVVETFKNHLQNIGYTETTVNMAYSCVKDFLDYTANHEPQNITTSQIKAYYSYLQGRKQKRKNELLSEAYINHQVYSLKLFFTWLEQTHQVEENPISNIKFKRPKINSREPLTQSQTQELFNAAKNLKEKALLHICYSCGLRRSEAVNLNLQDIDLANNLLYVREGKGAKRRVVPINKSIKKDLENYCLQYRKDKSNEAFMIGRIKQRMRGASYNNLLKKILKRTEIHTEVTLHHLRHSIATHLLENGMSIEFVRDFLGHSHLESTQIYAKVKTYQLKKL
jgi:integrase/recombinase XerD